MKIKILIVAALLVASIGFASATEYEMDITSPSSTILYKEPSANILEYTIDLTNVASTAGDLHNISVYVAGGSSADLLFKFIDPNSGESSWIGAESLYAWTNASSAQTLTMKVKLIPIPTSPAGTTYTMTVQADGEPPSGEHPLASATTYVTGVPEFPSIALPIAAILGLAFIFQRRKDEE